MIKWFGIFFSEAILNHSFLTYELILIFLNSDLLFFKLSVCSLGFPGGSDVKESACHSGDPGLVLPTSLSCLENSFHFCRVLQRASERTASPEVLQAGPWGQGP